MREIKFRALARLSTDEKEWFYYTTATGSAVVGIGDGIQDWIIKDSQYTGRRDKNGKEIYEGDKVKIWLPFWKDRSEYTGEVIYKDGEFRVSNIRDVEYNQTRTDYEPENFVRFCELYKVESTKYIPNFGEVADKISENLEYSEIIGNVYETPYLLSQPPLTESKHNKNIV